MPQKQKFTDQQYLNLYNENLNDTQIAKILNVSKPTITRKRYRLKLMPKNPQSNTNPTLSHEKLKESYKRYKIKQILKNPNFYKEKNKAYKQKNPNYWEQTTKKYQQTPKGKNARRTTLQKYYQKKLKENPNYNKEKYKKEKLRNNNRQRQKTKAV
jgi:hypothetical protein